MSYSSDSSGGLSENFDSSSSTPSIDSSFHEVSKLEADLYYLGLRGPRRRGPKLIFRTSKDVFTPPSGPEQESRHMQLLPVYEHHILSKGDLWPTIRSRVVKLLDQRNIQHSSVDLVRFSWVDDDQKNEDDEENEDDEDDGGDGDDSNIEDSDIKFSSYGTVVTTPVTIWVGVLPGTLTGEVAFKSSIDILDLLKEHGISDLDVAYRESVVTGFSGPELFAPVSNIDPLKAAIDPVTTALSLPIAGFQTLHTQGTMGFYFKAGQDLYAVTARHVLFPKDKSNNGYSYISGPKKEVVLMGSAALDDFQLSIQNRIDTMNHTVPVIEKRIETLTARLEGDGADAEQAATELEVTQCELTETQAAIDELKKFLVKIKKQWTSPKDRVIGHVVWAPPISLNTPVHGYTKDVCVIKLDKRKFLRNFRGNVLDLGPEIDPGKFTELMYPRIDVPPDFHYPDERLFKVRGILSTEGIRTPSSKNLANDPVRYVIKRGCATLTTIGCLNGFESHVRRYFAVGNCSSVEAVVYPYDSHSGPFSRRGDSGSIIVDALGKYVALLTGGTEENHFPDITYGTPMHWLWDVIKTQFPGANLYIEDEN